MHVLIVNFNLREMTDAGFRAMANEVASAFAGVPGLVGKLWLADTERNTYGGVYLWEDAAAMRAYLASDLGKGVAGNPNFANLSALDFELLSGPTTSSGGPVAASLTASAALAS
jgi:heme-degrading monooxygenase HmoA